MKDKKETVEVEGLDLETNDAALATLDFPSEKSMMRFFRRILRWHSLESRH